MGATPNGAVRYGRLLKILAVIGPGLIVMAGDNDAGAFALYTAAGAQYGFALLWVMVPLFPLTYFAQETVIRLGCATGRGYAALVFERLGPAWGWLALLDLIVVNFGTIVTEFVGIVAGLAYFGSPPWLSVAAAIALLVMVVATKRYDRWERFLLWLLPLNALLIPAVMILRPNYAEAAANYFHPAIPGGVTNADGLFLIMGLAGATIAPWQIFFQQSAIADKGLGIRDIPVARAELVIGSGIVQAGAFGLIVLAAALYHGTPALLTDPAQIAFDLMHRSGYFYGACYALALVNAGVVGGLATGLSNAWATSEVLGKPARPNRRMREVPHFYLVYAMSLVCAGAIVLIPRAPLERIAIGAQVVSAAVLPVTLVSLLILINDRKLLGAQMINGAFRNAINIAIIGFLLALSFVLVAQTVMQL